MRMSQYFVETYQGPHLNVNEDDAFLDIENEFFVLCDGIGGAGIGDIITKKTIEWFKESFLKACQDPDATMPYFYDPQYSVEKNGLINAMHFSHQNVLNFNNERKIDQKGAVNILVGSYSEHTVTLIASGNCKALLLRNGEVCDLALEQTMSLFSPEISVPYGNTIPMSCLGMYSRMDYISREFRPNSSDTLLLLTDGVYKYFSNIELVSIWSSSHDDYSQKVSKIFEIANLRGNLDNQSLMAISFS